MLGVTHAAAGAALGAAIGSIAGQEGVGAVVGAVAALLPDIDHPGSLIGRVLRPMAVWIEEKYGHRDSPTHTIMFCLPAGLIVGGIAVAVTNSILLVLCGVIGAVSHLFLDSMTRSGLSPLRIYVPGPPEILGNSNVPLGRNIKRQWLKVKELENSMWFQKRWRGPIYTGKDPREFLIAIFCLVAVVLIFYL